MEAHFRLQTVASYPRIRHSLIETDMDNPKPGLGENRRGLVGDSASLHNDPDEIVWNQHERVHHASQMQSLESPHVGRSDRNDGLRVLDSELEPLLHLDPLDDPMRLHDLVRVRVRPRPDSDPVATNHDPAAGGSGGGGGGGGRGGSVERQFGIGDWIGVEVEGLGEVGGGAKRRRVEVSGGGREQKEEDKTREPVAENEANKATDTVED